MNLNPDSRVACIAVAVLAVMNWGFCQASGADTGASAPRVERIWLTHQSPDNSKIVVSWETTEPGDSVVEFGTTPRLGETAKVGDRRAQGPR